MQYAASFSVVGRVASLSLMALSTGCTFDRSSQPVFTAVLLLILRQSCHAVMKSPPPPPTEQPSHLPLSSERATTPSRLSTASPRGSFPQKYTHPVIAIMRGYDSLREAETFLSQAFSLSSDTTYTKRQLAELAYRANCRHKTLLRPVCPQALCNRRFDPDGERGIGGPTQFVV